KFCDEVNQITNSETLSSIDSLEAVEHEEMYLTLNKNFSPSIPQNSISLKSANLQSANLSCFDEDKLSFSKTEHINNWLINLDNPDTQTLTPFSDILVSSCEILNNKEQNSPVLNRIIERTTNAANNSVVLVNSPHVFGQNIKNENSSETSAIRTSDSSSRAFKMEKPFVTGSPTFKFSKAWTTSESVTGEVATFIDQEKHSGLTQQNTTTSVHASVEAVAGPSVLPPNAQSARPLPTDSVHIKEIDPVQCSDTLGELKEVKGKRVPYFKDNKKELPLFSALQTVCLPHNTSSKDKVQKIPETSNAISKYDIDDHHMKIKYSSHNQNDMRLLKSILKKESKYDHRYFKALIINQDYKFGNQKAAAIRDSVELTKQKGKSTEIPKTIKKLRWFDEISIKENNAEESHSFKSRTEISQQCCQEFHTQTKSGASSNISVPACAVNSADRGKPKNDSISENVPLGGSEADPVPLNYFPVPSGYNFTKQAWLASKKEECKSLACNDDSKTQKANSQRRGSSVIRRPRSAKVQSGFRNTNRKSPVFQRSSESKAKTFLHAQGKVIVPHPSSPPPQSTSNVGNGKNIQEFQYQSVRPENSPDITTRNCFHSKCALPVDYHLHQGTQESSPLLLDGHSDLVTVMPSLPSYYTSECQTLAKLSHLNGTPTVALPDGALYCNQKCPVYEENHHNMALKTPGEDTVPRWKRGQNILGLNGRTADSTVTRRKCIVGSKQKVRSVKKRQNPGNLGQKYSEQMR
ncbi:PREDICTED: uncharacterized protein KIAA1377 homolog, partial [Elephantulus edwardii]|uniref:uncharacterized protein KIAA1377 homolog n=1 Tax=Elephantulus edwardii TaxID=28737 RepID=UPI0003F0D3C3